jgi:hypothetical protein
VRTSRTSHSDASPRGAAATAHHPVATSHARPIPPRRDRNAQLAADLPQPNIGDPVRLGHLLDGFRPDVLIGAARS